MRSVSPPQNFFDRKKVSSSFSHKFFLTQWLKQNQETKCAGTNWMTLDDLFGVAAADVVAVVAVAVVASAAVATLFA